MKKFLSFMLVLCLGLACAVSLVGCGKSPEEPEAAATSVVEFSVNPEVQVVLDENDKVVDINYLSEETQMIFSRTDFIGISAGEAGELFVKIASDCGKIDISKGYGNEQDGTTVSVKIYCKDSDRFEKLKSEIVSTANKYFKTYGIVAGAVATRMESLKESLAKIDTTIDSTDLTEDEVFALLVEKSEQLKDVYYSLRQDALAGIENVKTELEASIAKSQKKVTEIQAALLQVQKQYDAYSKELFINNVALDELKAKIAQLQAESLAYSTEIANVDTLLQTKIEEYLAQVREDSVAYFEQDFAAATEMFDNFKAELEAHQTAFEENFDLITAKIEVFQNSLNND